MSFNPDFMMVGERRTKNGTIEIYPKFMVVDTKDLMIRGGDFYAIWDGDNETWTTNEYDAMRIIDSCIADKVKEKQQTTDVPVKGLYLWDAESGIVDRWHKYVKDQQINNSFEPLNQKILFANSPTDKNDHATFKLSYELKNGETNAWDKLVGTLYSDEEKHKIEWCIGAIATGASKSIQKFLVFYGSGGTGKSTVINIIQKLFDGYHSTFNAKDLGSSSRFALESLMNDSLIGIQHDGDLSGIIDNTRLNSLISHEAMTVEGKYKAAVTMDFKAFLIIGTNKPVKITDSRSGIIRRLIDVSPTGDRVSQEEYDILMNRIDFEKGAIVYKCIDVFNQNPSFYDNYKSTRMIEASNDFYNFCLENYDLFEAEDGVTLMQAWDLYKQYCDNANVPYPMPKKNFKEELRNYFEEFCDRASKKDGTRVRNYYSGFKKDRFKNDVGVIVEYSNFTEKPWLSFDSKDSYLDRYCEDRPAQLANSYGTPSKEWDEVKTTLSDIPSSELHYLRPEQNHIVIDFDIPDNDGNKCLDLNMQAASKWPPTYAELSKSGQGIHLHYIYDGNVEELSRLYQPFIEIKVFTGKSSLRRKLSLCNSLAIATIASGLPLRKMKERNMINTQALESERELRAKILKALKKETQHSSTSQNVNFICMLLEKAYAQGLTYDVTDMQNDIYLFAASSKHQSDRCIKAVLKLKYKSDEPSEDMGFADSGDSDITFFDLEVYPNLLVICWKMRGSDKVTRMYNPSPHDVELLVKNKLVGFNNREYDNHILYARMLGYNNLQLYELSRTIIRKDKSNKDRDFDGKFQEAKKLSYTDVFDFASAPHKMSLKKYEILLGIHHQEMDISWDEPVPEELWEKVGDYCCNDVIATEKVFDYLSADWAARKMLAVIAKGTVNDTTNQLTTKFIFGNNRSPQGEFQYRDLGGSYTNNLHYCPVIDGTVYPKVDDWTVFDEQDRPVFPGYTFDPRKTTDKSTYRGVSVGEGGYVYANKGYFRNVALLDVASMHPTSLETETLLGRRYTKRFSDVKKTRILIKHGEFDRAREMFNGELAPFLQNEDQASDLANALKTVINSVYGLTAAKFKNAFKDDRNIDNIVAKRGALFMVNLQNVMTDLGATVVHIKTDSIKIANATPDMIKKVCEYGKMYGYDFEHEATYDRMCLVNDTTYIAKYMDSELCERLYGYSPGDNRKHGGEWTATGTQFAIPYTFKVLFSKEPLDFNDYCVTKSVTSSMYLNFNENSDEDNYVFVGKCGQFVPVKNGVGGGILVRLSENKKTGDTKYDSVGGTKGHRWMEAENLRSTGLESFLDESYHEDLVETAIADIEKYVRMDEFTDDTDVPPWEEPEDYFKKR